MFQGSANVDEGRALQPRPGRGRDAERQHVARPDELLRDPPRPRARAGAVARGRSHGEPAPGHDPGEARQPARRREERAPLEPSTTSRTATGTSASSRSSTPRAIPTTTRPSARWRTSSAASLDDVGEFFATYYAPNNAVLTDRRRLRGRCGPRPDQRRHFGPIPANATLPPPPDMIGRGLDRPGGSRDGAPPAVPLPRIYFAHRIPPFGTDEFDALDVAADVLGSGRASRLYAHLVREQQIAQDASVFVFPIVGRRGDVHDVGHGPPRRRARGARGRDRWRRSSAWRPTGLVTRTSNASATSTVPMPQAPSSASASEPIG